MEKLRNYMRQLPGILFAGGVVGIVVDGEYTRGFVAIILSLVLKQYLGRRKVALKATRTKEQKRGH